MKYAISTDGGNVSLHFGRCPEFTILEVGDNKLISSDIIPNPGHHPGFLPQFLKEKDVDYIVAGGMGMRAQELFDQENIGTILGISGKIDEIIEQVLNGSIESKGNICEPGGGKGYGIDKTECEHE